MDNAWERVLTRMDTLAHTLVARAAPVRFGLAGTAAETEDTYRLRAGRARPRLGGCGVYVIARHPLSTSNT
jgi:hypothetical protein